jgi:chorismate mutase
MGFDNVSLTIDPHVHAVVRSAEQEIRELIRQRADVMKRIGTIKQTLAGLADLFGDSILNDDLLDFLDRSSVVRQSGFTRACRAVLMESRVPLTARQVRDQVQKKIPGLIERHKDPLASVTTVLSRLVDYSEARCTVLGPGRRVWEWAAEMPLPVDSRPQELAAAGSD